MLKYRELTKEQRIRRGRKLMKKLILEELAKRKRDKDNNKTHSSSNE